MAIAETATATVLTPAVGGKGWQHTGEMVVEYSSTSAITLTGIPADVGNGSYGPPPITLPSTGGQTTKYFFRPGANKYKLIYWQFQFTAAASVFLEGFCCWTKSWGDTGSYVPTLPFAGTSGGEG